MQFAKIIYKSLPILKFVNVYSNSYHDIDAIGERCVEIIILRLIVEEIVERDVEFCCLPDTVAEQEFPKSIGGVAY